MERFIDIIYLLYFASHIPVAMFIDSQAVLPRWIYPKPAVDLVDWYMVEFGDSMMKGTQAWFQSFIVCEILLQFPFFFVALYAFWKGVSKNRWIRIPLIVYSTHVTTVLICIYHHLFLHDFSKDDLPGPKTTRDRVILGLIYFPYFIVPVMLLIDALFSSVYRTEPTQTRTVKPHSKKTR
ncbi:sigma intracellular receptor 2-like [Mercenaria mercenaria]|uniref:sigma intracellular receptor 2-like n=1 Tax=Mercenaria mercenaria TaxID=6596 RepID=UPI00234EA226|nr:sigma intracellular receptor 2-like [Mercenaria mercenaria]